MKILLDTHTLIWFLEDNPRLSLKVKSLIIDIDNEIFVSIATWFEISIKITIGKLKLPDSLRDTLAKSAANQITTIDISHAQISAYPDLPLFEEHRDPFDRMIITTASLGNYALASSDPKFRLYNNLVQIVW